MQDIVLAPLGLDDLGRLVARCVALRGRKPPSAGATRSTRRPAAIRSSRFKFLTALAEEGLFAFDPRCRCVEVGLARIRAQGYTDNVVALMIGKLKAAARYDPGSAQATRLSRQRGRHRHP